MNRIFPELVGNESLKKRLGHALNDNTFPHALLIDGPIGSGKHTLATQIAQALNCEEKGRDGNVPCGKCNNCRRIREKNFTDVKYIAKAPGKATIGVDDIRYFKEDMYLSATESAHKIYIIEDAQAMTVQAQNALLKAMEEPPSGVVILMLASSTGTILTTVRSRSLCLRMEYLSDSEIEEYLTEKTPRATELRQRDPIALADAIMNAQGNIGRAIGNLSDDVITKSQEDEKLVMDLLDCCASRRKLSDLYAALDSLPKTRQPLLDFFELTLHALRDLTVLKYEANAPLTFFVKRDSAAEYAAKFSKQRIIRLCDLFENTYTAILQNGNINLLGSVLADSIQSL